MGEGLHSLVVEELLACQWATHIILSRDSLCMGLASEAGKAPHGAVCSEACVVATSFVPACSGYSLGKHGDGSGVRRQRGWP